MLRVTEVEKIMPSAMGLTKWAQRDLAVAGGDFTVRRSEHVWSLTSDGETLLIFGIYAPSLTSVPELWMLMYKGFTKKLRANASFAKDYIDDLLEVYPRMIVRVEAGNKASTNFVEFLGFRYKKTIVLGGREYKTYEVGQWQ